ncbi:MAG TPA: pyridoxal phosphate-dependent aminotransferase [Candidatus Acidoferrum sp.]|nr:pyridoxal phosphate-dependent aminotransferase [Candidatus Acidoferrum sp.]
MSRATLGLRASGRRIFDLTRSNPTECGFAYDEEAIRRAFGRSGVAEYRPTALGQVSAREVVAEYYRADHDAEIRCENLVLTSGTSEGYSFLFRLLCNAGDEVLIPAPGYPLFDFLADLCDVKLVRFPLVYDHGWQIDFAELDAAANERTRAVIVVHPNNPTGHYVSALEQKKLGEFCREKGVGLIADEVFLDFSLRDGAAARSFASRGETLTFTLSGLSKICGMPQMKLAWIAVSGPEAERREALARLEIIADAYLSVGTPVQLAAPALLEMRDAFQEQVIQRAGRNLGELDRQLAGQTACSRLECEGGWTAVLRVPVLQTDEDLAIALLKARGVLVHPGHFYDFARPGHVVMSLIVQEQEFAEGMRRVLAHFT